MSVNEQLLKGRVAENIFELMFRETKRFDILPLGYEHVTPELAQYQHLAHVKKVYENIRHLPDFVLVSNDKKDVYFVEAKYRTHHTDEDILKIAEEILEHYNNVYLFLATPEKFYFETCELIKQNGGKINKLTWVEDEIQMKYLKLLTEFIR
jgi:hypothetical protein